MGTLRPVVDLKEWCEQYGIKAKDIVCDKCGAVHKPIETIAWKNYRGVKYTECEHMNPFTVVPLGEAATIWNGLKGLLGVNTMHFEWWTRKENLVEKHPYCGSKGQHTLDASKVDCKKCLKLLKKKRMKGESRG